MWVQIVGGGAINLDTVDVIKPYTDGTNWFVQLFQASQPGSTARGTLRDTYTSEAEAESVIKQLTNCLDPTIYS